jgi:hypothetical protein
MSRLIQLVVAMVFSLLFFMSAQASFDVSIGSRSCAIFADEATDDSKKEGDDKKEGGDKKEEAEPDCD